MQVLMVKDGNEHNNFEAVMQRLAQEKPESLGTFYRLFWEFYESDNTLTAEKYISIIDSLGLSVRVINSVSTAAASGLMGVLQKKLNEIKDVEDVVYAASRHPNFPGSDQFAFVEKFVKRFGDKMPPTELIKLQMLIQSKGVDLSSGELVFFVRTEFKSQHFERLKQTVLSRGPKNRRDVFEEYLSHFSVKDELSLEALKRLLSTLGVEYTDISEMQSDLLTVARDVELKLFEERLNSDVTRPTVEEIDVLSGYEFEEFLRNLFLKMGYEVEHTQLSGDQGADLVVSRLGEKTVVQAKCYSGSVGNYAVQEVFAACNLYGASKGMVVTNSYFTPAAVELAEANNVELVDRDNLDNLITKYW